MYPSCFLPRELLVVGDYTLSQLCKISQSPRCTSVWTPIQMGHPGKQWVAAYWSLKIILQRDYPQALFQRLIQDIELQAKAYIFTMSSEGRRKPLARIMVWWRNGDEEELITMQMLTSVWIIDSVHNFIRNFWWQNGLDQSSIELALKYWRDGNSQGHQLVMKVWR